jgi:RNA polymerase sigma-70 factor (ECF subfamily)
MEKTFIGKVKEARAGDKDALVELVLLRKDQLYRIAWSYFQNEYDAYDVLQETIAKAFHDIVNLRQPEYFYTWYIRILINTCKQLLLRKAKVIDLQEVIPFDTVSSSSDDSIDLKRAMAQLPQEYKEIIFMRYMEDLPIKDIAVILDIPEGTVKSRIHYGVLKLRDLIGEKEAGNYGV